MMRYPIWPILLAIFTLACTPDPLALEPAPARPAVVLDDPALAPPLAGLVQPVTIGSRASSAERALLRAPAHHTVYLRRGGGVYRPGWPDDAARNVSTLVPYAVDLSPYDGDDADWAALVGCMQEQFAPFDVTVTDVEPASGDYIETVFTADTAGVIGLGGWVAGYAPMDTAECSLLPRAIVLIFNGAAYSIESSCAIGAQEVGHALGLDHEYLCEDPMSYLGGCGPKRFQDQDTWCGEYSARECYCGGQQNSVQHMLRLFGPNPGPGGGSPDPSPPTVQVRSPADAATLPADGTIEVVAEAADDVALAAVELLWHFTSATLACPGSGTDWSCTLDGGRATWRLDVGSGARTYAVRARDRSGNVTTTEPRTLQLGGAPPPSTVPVVTLASPADGATLRAGEAFTVAAQVDDRGVEIASVRMTWEGGPSGSYTWPLERGAEPGRWLLETSMSAAAPAGERRVSVVVTNRAGESATSAVARLAVVR